MSPGGFTCLNACSVSPIDFHNAIIAGVDEVNHMPGFRGDPMKGGLENIKSIRSAI